MAKVKRGDRLERIVEGAERAAGRAVERTAELFARAEAAQDRLSAAAAAILLESEEATAICGRTAEEITRTVEEKPVEAVRAEAEKIDAAVASAKAVIQTAEAEARKSLVACTADVVKARDEALAAVREEVGKVASAGEALKTAITDAMPIIEEMRRALHDCKAAKGSIDEARMRLSEMRGSEAPSASPKEVREALEGAEQAAAEVDSHDPLVVGPVGG